MQRQVIAYLYMMLYLAEKYSENFYKEILGINPQYKNLWDKFNDFNNNNNFTQTKCNLLPFLITIGNGKKDDLLNFFNEFYPLSDGFIEIKLRESIAKNEFDNQKIFLSNDNYSIISTQFIDYLNNNKVVELKVQEITSFLRIDISPADLKLVEKACNNIKEASESINNNRNKAGFMLRDENSLSEWSKYNVVYQTYYGTFDEQGKIINPFLKKFENEIKTLIQNSIKSEIFENSPNGKSKKDRQNV